MATPAPRVQGAEADTSRLAAFAHLPRPSYPLSYRDRHILNRAKNFVAVAAPHSRGTNKCAWAWLRLAYPYSDSDFDLENYGVNHVESPPPRAKKAKGKKSRGASSRRSTYTVVRIALGGAVRKTCS